MSANFGGDTLASPSSPIRTPEDTFSSNPAHKLFTPEPIAADDDAAGDSSSSTSPLVICFHGSGETCSPSWDALTHILTAPPLNLRVLAFNRGAIDGDSYNNNPKPAQATVNLLAYLDTLEVSEGTQTPYVLVAHSYGGAFARTFLEHEAVRPRVAGVVLVETGQEGGLDAAVDAAQYRRRILGKRPLSVVRGNSLLGIEEEIAAAEARAETDVEMEGLLRRREMLGVWDKEDEKLKRRQLDLSARTAPKRYVNVPECGHHVVRDRPDVVAAEVKWVLENMRVGDAGKDDVDEDEEERGGEGEDEGEAEKREQGWGKIRRIWKEMFVLLLGRKRGSK